MTEPARFDKPPANARIWRYMDLARLASLLATKTLWFARVSDLEDKFEGSYPVPTARRLQLLEKHTVRVQLPVAVSRSYIPELASRRLRGLRNRAYVNCWYSGQDESAALWQSSSRNGASVAVQSSVGRLLAALDKRRSNRIHCSRVSYINYRTEDVPFPHELGVFFCKRASFDFEREVRLLIAFTDARAVPQDDGIRVRASVRQLIERLVIAPDAPRWHRDVIESLLKAYRVSVPVAPSSLDAQPIY
jgi:hypothetical protein